MPLKAQGWLQVASNNAEALQKALERIDHLIQVSETDPEFSESVSPIVAIQTKQLIRNAFSESGISPEVLDRTFITVLLYGALQIEWEKGPNQVEVLVDDEDGIEVLYWNSVTYESQEFENVKFDEVLGLAEKHLPSNL